MTTVKTNETQEIARLRAQIADLIKERDRYKAGLEHYADKDTWQLQTNISILAREYAYYDRNGYDHAQSILATPLTDKADQTEDV